ncbi:hypothetical protein POVWA2_025800 [Plasmodium ovale wallikeri]|uniref:Uncharacterized protein n=1 Tax=Plasmodium ovale wallikeri TaxID=864142 RepID=A0A1A8YVP1_PLAOA|nr:hypothetical protein POVWA1_025970 [Plasmodium ovale wallikeri]SBT35601.1 hypothetical protein POVWA2_025800 [Plasmodium ovale wallikeri]
MEGESTTKIGKSPHRRCGKITVGTPEEHTIVTRMSFYEKKTGRGVVAIKTKFSKSSYFAANNRDTTNPVRGW